MNKGSNHTDFIISDAVTCRKDVTVLLLLCVCFLMSNLIIAQPSSHCRFKEGTWSPKTPSNNRLTDNKEKLSIPVVFHIVYNGVNQQISDEQIQTQLQVINEDFNFINENKSDILQDFLPVAADIEINFYLAEDNGVFGITKTATTHGPFFDDDLHLSEHGGQDAWDTNKYLNVWVADLANGIFGYASSPGTADFKDGMAIHYEYFGRKGGALAPYDLGRTLTHEIGHWLGLLHPWGNGGCDSDDGLSDTPLQQTSIAGCNLQQTSCGSLDMIQNFMNTSEDACLAFFTEQQRDLMRSTLINDRPEAYSVDNIIATITKGQKDENRLILHPNPVTTIPYAYANLPMKINGSVDVNVFDAMGRSVRQANDESVNGKIVIDFTGLNNGWYTTQLSNNKSVYSSRIYLTIE